MKKDTIYIISEDNWILSYALSAKVAEKQVEIIVDYQCDNCSTTMEYKQPMNSNGEMRVRLANGMVIACKPVIKAASVKIFRQKFGFNM